MADRTEQKETGKWVDDQIAVLRDVVEIPTDIEGRLSELQRMLNRFQHRRKAMLWTISGVAVVMVIILATPSARLRAQVLFQRLTLRGIQIVGVRPDLYSALLFEWSIPPRPAHLVIGPEEAAREAGIVPNLPDWTMVSQPVPSFGIGVMGGGAGRYQIRISDMRSALTRAGANDIAVPDSWDGAEVAIEMNPVVYVSANKFLLLQFLPGHVLTPPGFDLVLFVEALLRIGGMPERQARTLAQGIGANPGVLLGMPSDFPFDTYEIPLRAGKGVVIKNNVGREPPKQCFLCPSPGEVLVAWQSSRVYVLKTNLTESRTVDIANSLP